MRVRTIVMAGTALVLAVAATPVRPSSASTMPTLSVTATSDVAAPHPTTMTFTSSLSSVSSTAVTFTYRTADGTAHAGTNYTATSGSAMIPAGSRHVKVSVPISAAALTGSGGDKSFTLTLSNPTGAVLGTATAAGVIHPDPYLASKGGLVDAVIAPSSTTAYITNSSLNEVEVLNLRTGAYGKPIDVGSQPAGIDITPDGTTLYVCDSGGQAISVVSVATGKVLRTITTPAGFDSERAYSIAVANNGHAVFTTTFYGSGFGAHVYDLTLSNDAITVLTGGGIGGQVTEATPVVRSADRSTIAGILGDDSGGPYFVYHASDGSVTGGSLNGFFTWPALSGSGSTLLVDAGTVVVNTATNSMTGTITGGGYGVALNSSGTTGYRQDGTAIGVLTISRFLETSTIPEPSVSSPGVVVMAPNNGYLVALSGSGATIVRL